MKPLCKHDSHVEGCPACRLWAGDDGYRRAVAGLYGQPPPPPVLGGSAAAPPEPPPPGPGTRLKEKLAGYGVPAERPGCGCKDWVAWMDRLGVEGCRANRADIVKRLTEQAAKLKWYEMAAVGVRMAADGIFTIGGLVDAVLGSSPGPSG